MYDLNSIEEFDEAVAIEGRAVVLFTAPSWCAPCRGFEPHWERARETLPEINFFRVNEVDKQEWAMVGFSIKSVPTCLLYEDGQFIRRVTVPQNGIPFIKDIGS